MSSAVLVLKLRQGHQMGRARCAINILRSGADTSSSVGLLSPGACTRTAVVDGNAVAIEFALHALESVAFALPPA